MKNKGDFDLDLQDGQVFEEALRSVLTNRTGSIKIECKTDKRVHETGNLYFEYESRGERSGLATTKADWFAVGCYGHGNSVVLMFRVPYLKQLLQERLSCRRAIKASGGDEDTSKGVLVNVAQLLMEVKHGT